MLAIEILCVVCGQAGTLPDTVPQGDRPRCGLCATLHARYLPCQACEHAYHPDHGCCPRCGIAASVGTPWNSTLGLPDRLVFELLDALRQPPPAQVVREPAVSAPKQPEQPVKSSPAPRSPAPKLSEALNSPAPVTFARPPAANHAASPLAATPAAPPPAPDTPPEPGEGFSLFEDEAATSAVPLVRADYELIVDEHRLAEVVDALVGTPVVAVDTETTGLDPFAENAAAGAGGHHGARLPGGCPAGGPASAAPHPGGRAHAQAAAERQVRLQDARASKTASACATCTTPCSPSGCSPPGSAARSAWPRWPRSTLGVTLDKSIRSSFIDSKGEFSEEQLRYAARDALVLFTHLRRSSARRSARADAEDRRCWSSRR